MTIDDLNAELARCYAAAPGRYRRVLEGGAGSQTHFRIEAGAVVVALDISFGQLVRNTAGALPVVGDLQRAPLGDGCADVAICFNVLEHLDDPQAAMAELRRCLAPGGLLVLGLPNRSSLKGLVTRATPIGLHRAWYRRIVGKRDRGEGHFDAFPTVFHPATAVPRVLGWLEQHGFRLSFYRAYDGVAEYGVAGSGAKGRVVRAGYDAVCRIGRWLSLGAWRPEQSDILLLARLAG